MAILVAFKYPWNTEKWHLLMYDPDPRFRRIPLKNMWYLAIELEHGQWRYVDMPPSFGLWTVFVFGASEARGRIKGNFSTMNSAKCPLVLKPAPQGLFSVVFSGMILETLENRFVIVGDSFPFTEGEDLIMKTPDDKRSWPRNVCTSDSTTCYDGSWCRSTGGVAI